MNEHAHCATKICQSFRLEIQNYIDNIIGSKSQGLADDRPS